MDNGGTTPPYGGNSPSLTKTGAEQEKHDSQGSNSTTSDLAAAKKQSEVQFKAAHGLLVAFFTLIMSGA